jgi:alanyl-tRNA synthetase
MKSNSSAAQVKLSSTEIRSRFLAFFADKKRRSHTIIPSASLVTSDEKGITNPTLFNTAGMQPLIPYLLGKPYIIDSRAITRLVDVQKCLRTVDIDDIGDKTHATFFEMLGNWSLGDYFKKEAIEWSYEFLTSTSDKPGDQGLGLDPRRLYVTVFAGDANASKDTESASVWESVGVPKHRIYFKDSASNWWPAVKSTKEDNWTGPTGPCSEMFYDITEKGLGDLSPEAFEKADQEQKVVEIWNDVFMEFEKKEGTIVGKLARKNVDTGAGLERLATVLQEVDNIYDTDLFKLLMDRMDKSDPAWNIETGVPKEKSFFYEKHTRAVRIIADHTRASVFIIGDGIIPSNTDRGYTLRRLIRRAIFHCIDINLQLMPHDLVDSIVEKYGDTYPVLSQKKEEIKKMLFDEYPKFTKTLASGLKELEKMSIGVWPKRINGEIVETGGLEITGKNLFFIYSTYGFPFEMSIEEINKRKKHLQRDYGFEPLSIDEVKKLKDEFDIEMKKHQELSRAGAEQKFKGGLADASDPIVVRYHTATHLLHQALHDVFDKEADNNGNAGQNTIEQKGSNITAERLRFDFSFPRKMTDEEKKRVEDIVNENIAARLPVGHVVMPRAEAEQTGARHFFNEKYGEEISIYYIGADLAHAYSKEFCGGPHVKNTFELAGEDGEARFKIVKEEAVAQGVRRIKAVLE